MSRHTSIVVILVLLNSLVVTARAQVVVAERPNVVFILADDKCLEVFASS